MRMRSVIVALVFVLCVCASLWALRDPEWIGSYTTGLLPPEVDEEGTTFQWTEGRASFFIPAASPSVEFALSTHQHGSTRVWVSIDGAPADEMQVHDEWQTVRLQLTTSTKRRFRRIDVRVARASGEDRLGVRLARLRY